MNRLWISALLTCSFPAAAIAQGASPSTDTQRVTLTKEQQSGAQGDAMAIYQNRTQLIKPCPREVTVDIIVCGRVRSEAERSRLPLPVEEGPSAVRGEVPAASAAYGKSGGCSNIGGQVSGCTGGFNIFVVAGVLAKAAVALADPDGDHSPPPPLPDRFKGAGQH